MAIQLKVINKKTLQEMNTQLAKLKELFDACDEAKKAGVPIPDAVQQGCIDLTNRINQFKATYFSQSI
jgi:hypothetical protein